MKEKIKIWKYKLIRKIIYFFGKYLKIENNRILFQSFKGTQYSCNPKYISEYLQKNSKIKYDIIWVDKGIKNLPVDVNCVKYMSLKYIYYYFTSKCIVSNNGFKNSFKKPSGQYRIETWHGGGAYKIIRKNLKPVNSFVLAINGAEIDFHLSSCKKFSEVMPAAQQVDKEKFIETGMPRNDIFFDESIVQEKKMEIKKLFNVVQRKIILYAPTWRDDGRGLEIEELIDAVKHINDALTEDYVLMCRAHHSGHFIDSVGNYIDVTDYPDMQELLCAADVLITDYSSCMWDFSLTYKPCFIYATDLEKYIQERDFYTPLNEWPFPIAPNKDELISNIINFDYDEYYKSVKKHHEALGTYEDGHACEKVCKLIDHLCRGE